MAVLTEVADVGRQRAMELHTSFVKFDSGDFARHLTRVGGTAQVCTCSRRKGQLRS